MAKNLFQNGDFKDGTRDWSLQTVSTLDSNNWPTGTLSAGAANFTQSSSTTAEALEGRSSGKWVKSNVNAQRQGFQSEVLQVDKELQGNVVRFKFSYQLTQDSGTLSLTGVVGTHDIKIAFYDITNSVWIQPSGHLSINSVGVQATASGEFQMPLTTAQIKMFIYQATTSTASWTLVADYFFLGKAERVYGSIVTDWQSFTPTGSLTTNATYTGRWRRVGDAAEVETLISFSGVNTQGPATIITPFTIDTGKLTTSSGDKGTVGQVVYRDEGSDSLVGTANVTSSTTISLGVTLASNSYAGRREINTSTNLPVTVANTDAIFVRYTIPVLGWASSVQMSSDADTRVVAADYTSTTTAVGSGSEAVLVLTSKNVDTHGAYNTSTGKFTVPIPGYYRLSGAVGFTDNGGNAVRRGRIYKNSSAIAESILDFAATSPSSITKSIQIPSVVVSAVAGDTFDLRFTQSTGSSVTPNNDLTTHFSVEKVSGPSTIAASDTISMSAINTSGQSIPNNTTTTLTGWTEDYDDQDCFNASTGVYTAKISGKYTIKASTLYVPTGSPPFNTQWNITASKNSGAVTRRLAFTSTQVASALAIIGLSGGTDFRLQTGDTLQVTAFQNSGSAQTIDAQTQISITRVGNY